MAKPEHTAYMVMGDFTHLNTEEYIVTHTAPVGLDPNCVSAGVLKAVRQFVRSNRSKLTFNHPDESHVSFGFDSATRLLEECRQESKQQFKKGARPTFFLRRMTMSEFMAHSEFKKYRTSNKTVQKVFKKYLLLTDLRDSGFQ